MQLHVNIDFGVEFGTFILSKRSYSPQANISHIDKIYDPNNADYLGFQGFHFSSSPLDNTYKLYGAEGYQGYVSSNISDNDGNINVFITSGLSGDVPNLLYIRFDAIEDTYAVDFTISNNKNTNTIEITDNTETELQINLEELKLANPLGTTITVTITKWNKANANVKITQLIAIATSKTFIDELVSCELSENLLDAKVQVAPGIAEQYANIQLYDKNGIIHQLAEQEILTKNNPVTISIIDEQEAIIIGKFYTSEWNIEGNNSIVSLDCKDNSESLDHINFNALESTDRSVHEMLTSGFNAAKNTTWEYIDTDTAEYCKSIITPSSWSFTSTILEFLNKICDFAMLRIYWYVDRYIVARCY